MEDLTIHFLRLDRRLSGPLIGSQYGLAPGTAQDLGVDHGREGSLDLVREAKNIPSSEQHGGSTGQRDRRAHAKAQGRA